MGIKEIFILFIISIILKAIINSLRAPRSSSKKSNSEKPQKSNLSPIKEVKKDCDMIEFYNTAYQEFKEKIRNCINTRDREWNISKKEAIEIENNLHKTILVQLTKIEWRILQDIKGEDAIDIDDIKDTKSKKKTLSKVVYITTSKDTKLRIMTVFSNILSLINLRKHIFSETEELNEDYIESLILTLFVKTHPNVLTNCKEFQEEFELLKKEIIELEKQKYTTVKNFAGNSQTFIETLEDFAEIVRITFRNFDELCSTYNTSEIITEEKESKTINKYNPNINKYRIII
ncbi:MAG: hypothetical protein JHC31_15935 [Sulfurihydrogenibium sp.]|jgi:hypothetical protein|nr:hypothetical protein [Sulfurihydrogenibium sp.]